MKKTIPLVGSGVWFLLGLACIGAVAYLMGAPWYLASLPAIPLALFLGLFLLEVAFINQAIRFFNWLCDDRAESPQPAAENALEPGDQLL